MANTLPKLTLVNLNSNVLNAIRGETIIGQDSGAAAAFVSSNGSNEIEYVPLNENPFSTNELIKKKSVILTFRQLELRLSGM